MVSVARSFLHLSDLHFGRHDELALEALYSYLNANKSEIERLLITGDFTQRARTKQFTEAANFIENSGFPVVAVPGNHDVPLYNLWRRVRSPYKKYERHLDDLVDHEFEDDGILILGVRTTNVWTVQSSRFTNKEADRISKRFSTANDKIRLLLLHHPLSQSSDSEINFLQKIIESGADIVLSGHGHNSFAKEARFGERKVLLCSAGTTISDRLREENNSFNKICIHDNIIRFQTFSLNVENQRFELKLQNKFQMQI